MNKVQIIEYKKNKGEKSMTEEMMQELEDRILEREFIKQMKTKIYINHKKEKQYA